MARHVSVQPAGDLSPAECARAGFRAGWEAACRAVAAGLRAAGAPPAFVDAVADAASSPPACDVETHVTAPGVRDA